MRARTVRVDRWEKTPTRTAQDKIKIKNPGRQQPCWGLLFCTNLTQPTGNLDAASAETVANMLTFAASKYQQTIVMVTHDRQMAEYADRILTITDGNVTGGVGV